MKAVVVPRTGGPEVLEVRDLPDPIPQSGEVLVRVEAVGVNFADTLSTRGVYKSTPPPPFVVDQNVAVTTVGTTPPITNTPPGTGQIACSMQSVPP